MEHCEDIVRARETIRRKYNALRHGETEESIALEKHFKPVAEPLKAILRMKDVGRFGEKEQEDKNEANILKKQQVLEAEPVEKVVVKKETFDSSSAPVHTTSKLGPLARPYFDRLYQIEIAGKKSSEFDQVYGIRHREGADGEWMIGDKSISFDKKDKIYVDGKKFTPATPGLLELIFKGSPQEYSTEDLENYKRLLEKTHAHKHSYAAEKPIRTTRAKKYTQIIRPLFEKVKKEGSGLFVPLTPKRSYVYWDNPNELVQRLALLIASKEAGHTGHEREILSIEEELREGRYIL